MYKRTNVRAAINPRLIKHKEAYSRRTWRTGRRNRIRNVKTRGWPPCPARRVHCLRPYVVRETFLGGTKGRRYHTEKNRNAHTRRASSAARDARASTAVSNPSPRNQTRKRPYAGIGWVTRRFRGRRARDAPLCWRGAARAEGGGGGPEPEAGGAPTVLSAGRGAPPTKDAVVSISAARHYGRRRPFDVNVGVASGTRGRGARYTWRLRVPRTQTRPHSASAALTLAEEQTAREDGARASHFHYVASTLSIIKAVLCFFFNEYPQTNSFQLFDLKIFKIIIVHESSLRISNQNKKYMIYFVV